MALRLGRYQLLIGIRSMWHVSLRSNSVTHCEHIWFVTHSELSVIDSNEYSLCSSAMAANFNLGRIHQLLRCFSRIPKTPALNSVRLLLPALSGVMKRQNTQHHICCVDWRFYLRDLGSYKGVLTWEPLFCLRFMNVVKNMQLWRKKLI